MRKIFIIMLSSTLSLPSLAVIASEAFTVSCTRTKETLNIRLERFATSCSLQTQKGKVKKIIFEDKNSDTECEVELQKLVKKLKKEKYNCD
jgi:hypothetical protein